MASIYYAETAEYATEGLQGSDVCDEAWRAAKRMSACDPDRQYVLEDDDGVYLFEAGEMISQLGDRGEEWGGSTT